MHPACPAPQAYHKTAKIKVESKMLGIVWHGCIKIEVFHSGSSSSLQCLAAVGQPGSGRPHSAGHSREDSHHLGYPDRWALTPMKRSRVLPPDGDDQQKGIQAPVTDGTAWGGQKTPTLLLAFHIPGLSRLNALTLEAGKY